MGPTPLGGALGLRTSGLLRHHSDMMGTSWGEIGRLGTVILVFSIEGGGQWGRKVQDCQIGQRSRVVCYWYRHSSRMVLLFSRGVDTETQDGICSHLVKRNTTYTSESPNH